MERVHPSADGLSRSITLPSPTTSPAPRVVSSVPNEAASTTTTLPHNGFLRRVQRMHRRRRRGPYSPIGWYRILQGSFRALGWLTTIVAIVIMAFMVNRWHDKGGAIAAGIVGAAIALLNDSWQMISHSNNSLGFRALSPARALLHDIFALAICLGSIVLLIFSSYTFDDTERIDGQSGGIHSQLNASDHGDAFSEARMLRASLWSLAAIVMWRAIFAIWGCYDCFVEFHHARVRMRLPSNAGSAF